MTRLYSVTDQFIMEPLVELRKPLAPEENSLKAKVWHFVKSEVLARILAVFTSVFALVDFVGHFAATVVKGGLYGVKYCCRRNPSEEEAKIVRKHFDAFLEAFGLTIIGSVAGVIAPSILDNFWIFGLRLDLLDKRISDIKRTTKIINYIQALENGFGEKPFTAREMLFACYKLLEGISNPETKERLRQEVELESFRWLNGEQKQILDAQVQEFKAQAQA